MSNVLQFIPPAPEPSCSCGQRDTTAIWKELQNLPMKGGNVAVHKRRAALIRELQGQGVTFIESGYRQQFARTHRIEKVTLWQRFLLLLQRI